MNGPMISCGKTGCAIRILGQLSIAVVLTAWSNGLLANEVAPARYLAFLIDEKGKIVQISYKLKPEGTVPNAKQALNVS